MPVTYENDTARRNLKNLMDLLSDSHSEITDKAARVNAFMLKSGNEITRASMAQRSLAVLEEALDAHAARCIRVRDEIGQIKNNLKVA
jgi:hypothetical protein